MFGDKKKWITLGMIAMLALPTLPAATPASAQAQRFFPETGKTVKGRFLEYWTQNGQLAQQGYPLTEEMREVSDTDGKTYTVQYFERAVFEHHPENGRPYDVLLQLLGSFLYNQKYRGNAPGQQPNTQAGSRLFTETGKRVGGRFLDYWNRNGGLAQQGLPLSEEFDEVSDLDGKRYRVQYFERAVFEYHPENQPAFQVLLSQLGTFRLRSRGQANNPPPPPPPAQGGRPTACGNLPENVNAATDRNQYRATERIRVAAGGFTHLEPVSYWFTFPDGSVLGTASPVPLEPDEDGVIGPYEIGTGPEFAAARGIWALTFQGQFSKNTAVAWFCITP
ncbi:MAG: hypothetical protein M3441_10140 [Chloroflexota bacterium]|nr:hypothetical protein [Chloroflexota bacterium]